ncbi:hypothetical protein QZH41_002349 [Actinostola sp. cb2023]|nr:hypothetical protein QZH41_002349 [Actinostola sp. cb2023]
MYCSLLTDRSLTLAFKSRGLELLPYFTRLPKQQLSSLKSCLDTLVADCFPLRSTEFIVGSPKYNDYIDAFDKPSDPMFENQIISKLCCFKLIEVLYTRLNKNDLNSPQSPINKAYCDAVQIKTGKELTMAITKCAHSVKSEDMRGETVLLDLRRQLHCYAYNALVALISCTQVEQKFYVGFLFTENTIKGQFLFDNLIDCNRKYEFETVLSAPIARKKQMMSIRTDARSRDREESGSPGYNTGRSIRYLSSQYLADSSLSEEVSHFDFSTPIQAFAATDVVDAAPSEPENDTQDEEETFKSIEDTVEMDELNQHECMGKLCALLKHLTSNIASTDNNKMPAWMKAIHNKFSSYDTHINVKLLIAKVIVNEAKIFEPYAKFWLTPLVEMVLKMFQDEGPMSRGLNYFIVDVLVTMLFWSGSAIPEDTIGDRHLASRLVEAVVSRTHHENRSVFRNNLEIVKTMVEVWKNRIHVPTNEKNRECTAPHHTTPHRTTPYGTAPHHTTPYGTAPHHTAPHHTAPHHTTPHHTVRHRTTPHRTAPHHTAPHHTTPYGTAPHRTTPHHTVRHHTTPRHRTTHTHRTAPHHTTPHRTAPHRTAPHRTTPHHTAPHRTTPHRTAPHHTTPYGTTPHHTTPYGTAPHRTTPHRTAPHHTTPYGTAPHHTAPHHTAPHHRTHRTAPHRTAPHRTAPHHRTHRTAPHTHTAPHHTTPYGTTPHHTTPHHTTPHHTAPHRTTPHHTSPHHTTPHQ